MRYETFAVGSQAKLALWKVKIYTILTHMDLDIAQLSITKMPSFLSTKEKRKKDNKF